MKKLPKLLIAIIFATTIMSISTYAQITGTYTDVRDGQIYKTVKIGDRVWMAENLNFDAGDSSWVYPNTISNAATYGRLYNWTTACNVCPDGWYLPSDDEWSTLECSLGMKSTDVNKKGRHGKGIGPKLRSTGGWQGINNTNISGFSALPGGYRYGKHFYFIGKTAQFWTSTEDWKSNSPNVALMRFIPDNTEYILRDIREMNFGLSVRCIKDESWNVHEVAVEKITDHDLLYDIAKNEENKNNSEVPSKKEEYTPQNKDLIIRTNGDSIICKITNEDSLNVYISIEKNENQIDTYLAKNDISEIKKDIYTFQRYRKTYTDAVSYDEFKKIGSDGEKVSKVFSISAGIIGGPVALGFILSGNMESLITAVAIQAFAADILMPISVITMTSSVSKKNKAFISYGIKSEDFSMINLNSYRQRAINSMWISIGCNIISMGSYTYFLSNINSTEWVSPAWVISGMLFEIPAVIFASRSLKASKMWSKELNNSYKADLNTSSKISILPKFGLAYNEFNNKINMSLGITLEF
ncbi:FISUMP domain-containing protein [Bacteroidota bacterium]